MKLDSVYSLLFLGLLASGSTAGAIMILLHGKGDPVPRPGKCKSQMKQISTTVHEYFKDKLRKEYPKNPHTFEIKFKKFFYYSNDISTWQGINLNSPFYFFCNEHKAFTGKANVPLLTNWDPVKYRNKEFLFVAWEDGHVSKVIKEEQERLIGNSLSGLTYKLYRDLTFQTNPAVE